MLRHLICAMLLLLAWLPAHAAVEDFIWFENSEGIEPIDLSKGHTKPAGITWSYAVDCSQQSANGKNSLFSCTVDGSGKLIIKLTEGQTGSGVIKVVAVARDASGSTTSHNYDYTVTVVPKPPAYVAECADWTCDFHRGLYAGVEGTSVSQVNDATNIRLQYTGYSQFDNAPLLGRIHIFGRLSQSSLQEQAALEESCPADEGEECDIDATIGGRLGVFRPWGDYEYTVITGPYLEYQIQKLGSDKSFARSYYAGIRFAHSKVRFFSIGYGKTEDLAGNRVDITGQFPLYNKRLFAGMTLNLAYDDEAKESAGDSINVYVMTKVDFSRIFTNF